MAFVDLSIGINFIEHGIESVNHMMAFKQEYNDFLKNCGVLNSANQNCIFEVASIKNFVN
jgi:hypothetical protein